MDNDGDGRSALTAARLSCGSCGTQLGPAAKFCSECGTPVAHSAQSAEYKQVTVLFADVVHSMEIAAAVGAERRREIMADNEAAYCDCRNRYRAMATSLGFEGQMQWAQEMP